jgi:prophage regulatory protein
MAHPNEDTIVDRRQLRELVPVSDSQLRRLESAGRFPRRVKLGANRVGWLLGEIQQWIAQRKADRIH